VATSPVDGAIVRYQSYTPRAGLEGDIDALPLWAGQSTGLVSEVKPAREIVHEIAAEAEAVLQRLGG
jgi:NAD(P)H-dependent flavin oxidoreductase YrpB (nitropropane dioxygenase family)